MVDGYLMIDKQRLVPWNCTSWNHRVILKKGDVFAPIYLVRLGVKKKKGGNKGRCAWPRSFVSNANCNPRNRSCSITVSTENLRIPHKVSSSQAVDKQIGLVRAAGDSSASIDLIFCYDYRRDPTPTSRTPPTPWCQFLLLPLIYLSTAADLNITTDKRLINEANSNSIRSDFLLRWSSFIINATRHYADTAHTLTLTNVKFCFLFIIDTVDQIWLPYLFVTLWILQILVQCQ